MESDISTYLHSTMVRLTIIKTPIAIITSDIFTFHYGQINYNRKN